MYQLNVSKTVLAAELDHRLNTFSNLVGNTMSSMQIKQHWSGELRL